MLDFRLTEHISTGDLISDMGKLCIAMFAFLTGYAVCIQTSKNHIGDTGSITYMVNVVKKILSIFMSFWLMLYFVLLPVYCVIGNPFPTMNELMMAGVGINNKI